MCNARFEGRKDIIFSAWILSVVHGNIFSIQARLAFNNTHIVGVIRSCGVGSLTSVKPTFSECWCSGQQCK